MVQPLVTRLVLGGDGHGTALLRSAATPHRSAPAVAVPGAGTRRRRGPTTACGRLLVRTTGPRRRRRRRPSAPGGFTLVRR